MYYVQHFHDIFMTSTFTNESNSGANRDPVPSTLTQHVSAQNRNKPTPKPRSQKSLTMSPCAVPIQESEGNVSQLLHSSLEKRDGYTCGKLSHHKPREYELRS